ncbi:aminoglycoside phosphotransferase family protein [Streptomyces sp. NPDC020707]|uniref:aminoglycoside phosphotransferase family protein n=1 Tax=Streptomyces sp. NPDC020707 TaxID=3365084 RepID=UPI00379F25DB
MTRLQWSDLPDDLREHICGCLGDRVISSTPLTGGFSPGMTAVLTCAGGDEFFVKAVSSRQNSYSPVLYRQEAYLNGLLPSDRPAPRFLWSTDHADWAVLAFERISGKCPETPWKQEELQAVLAEVRRLPRAAGRAAQLPAVRELFEEELVGWRELAGRAAAPSLHPWIMKHLAELAELEQQWEQVVDGPWLVHGDLRSDNVLIVDGAVILVDWAYACRGSKLFDVVLLLLSAVAQGGCAPRDVLRDTRYVDPTEREAALILLATFTGWFTWLSTKPPVPGLPTLRTFQTQMATAGRRCLELGASWS